MPAERHAAPRDRVCWTFPQPAGSTGVRRNPPRPNSSQARTLKGGSPLLATVDRLLRIAEEGACRIGTGRLRYALSKRTLVETLLIRCARTRVCGGGLGLKRVETFAPCPWPGGRRFSRPRHPNGPSGGRTRAGRLTRSSAPAARRLRRTGRQRT